jgi:hypothetical protein
LLWVADREITEQDLIDERKDGSVATDAER